MEQERLLDKVQALLDRANHPNTPAAERETAFRMADGLMAKHRIDEAMLAFRQSGKVKVINAVRENLPFVPSTMEFVDVLSGVVAALAQLADVRVIITHGDYDPKDKFSDYMSKRIIATFGMEDDVKYFQMLWLNAYMTYSSKLFPQWDNAHTLAWNIKSQKEAGVKWGSIWDAAKRNGWPGVRQKGKVDVMAEVRLIPGWVSKPGDQAPSVVAEGVRNGHLFLEPTEFPLVGRCPKDGGYFKRLYELQCDMEGVEPTNHTQRNAAYRESYALGFQEEIRTRAWDLIRRRSELEHGTPGATVALRSGKHLVDALYDEIFPPSSRTVGDRYRRQHQVDVQGTLGGQQAARQVSLMADRNNVRNGPEDRKALG